MYKNIRRNGGRGIRVSREVTRTWKERYGYREGGKYERSSLLPTNILKTSPGSMPENELRSKIHGLYDSFFCGVYGLPSGMQVMSGCQSKFSIPRLVSEP